jgi:hypothetical protein
MTQQKVPVQPNEKTSERIARAKALRWHAFDMCRKLPAGWLGWSRMEGWGKGIEQGRWIVQAFVGWRSGGGGSHCEF